jgi:hypothetical protein
MKRKTKYCDEPLGKLEIVSYFLPPPEKLVLRDDGVKVTISLSKHSVDFFKRYAARSKVPYQKMIRSLLDGYVKHHETEPALPTYFRRSEIRKTSKAARPNINHPIPKGGYGSPSIICLRGLSRA